ncbi:hypothetical protein BH10PSE14_BH10PSE14_11700 [soil metagenome]
MTRPAACLAGKTVRSKLLLFLTIILAACGSKSSAGAENNDTAQAVYLSIDYAHVMVFTEHDFRTGDLHALLEGLYSNVPAKSLRLPGGISCISIGHSGSSEEFAIKRPIKLGEKYQCLGSIFTVQKCFQDCKSAVVFREIVPSGPPRSDGLKIPSYMLVDECRGMVALNYTNDFSAGIPHNSLLLRGDMGILNTKSLSACERY